MINLNNVSVLELVEELFSYEPNSPYASEESLSELFDQMLEETNFFDTYDQDDSIAINEEFHNWKDGLCRDGLIHESQCNDYCYVGEYA